MIEDDIRNIEIQSLMLDLGLEPGELDLLFGGPPCQAFSQIGKRQSILDERGMLLFEMVRFAKALQPKMILIEQVKGLLNAQDHHGIIGGVFRMIVQDLQKLGYTTKWKIMSSADYGVPQIRLCLIIHGRKWYTRELTIIKPERYPTYGVMNEQIDNLSRSSRICHQQGALAPWAEHRRVLNGIFWKLRTGAPWRDSPDRYGPYQTLYD